MGIILSWNSARRTRARSSCTCVLTSEYYWGEHEKNGVFLGCFDVRDLVIGQCLGVLERAALAHIFIEKKCC
jgi:hypothetical protein